MIQFVNVHKSFNGHPVLKGITMEIPDEKVTVILGPSGEGKSVLLKHVIGLMRPDSGHVIVDGVDLSSLDDKELNQFR